MVFERRHVHPALGHSNRTRATQSIDDAAVSKTILVANYLHKSKLSSCHVAVKNVERILERRSCQQCSAVLGNGQPRQAFKRPAQAILFPLRPRRFELGIMCRVSNIDRVAGLGTPFQLAVRQLTHEAVDGLRQRCGNVDKASVWAHHERARPLHVQRPLCFHVRHAVKAGKHFAAMDRPGSWDALACTGTAAVARSQRTKDCVSTRAVPRIVLDVALIRRGRTKRRRVETIGSEEPTFTLVLPHDQHATAGRRYNLSARRIFRQRARVDKAQQLRAIPAQHQGPMFGLLLGDRDVHSASLEDTENAIRLSGRHSLHQLQHRQLGQAERMPGAGAPAVKL